jgi:hypothetical protein
MHTEVESTDLRPALLQEKETFYCSAGHGGSIKNVTYKPGPSNSANKLTLDERQSNHLGQSVMQRDAIEGDL